MIYRVRAALILLAIAGAIVPVPAAWVERLYSRTLYPALQSRVTSLSNLTPLALLDIASMTALVLLAAALARDWRALGPRRAALRAGARLVTGAAVVYVLFLITWGMNYRRVPLEARLDFDRTRISREALRQFATIAIERVNAGYADAHAASFQADSLEHSFADAQRLLGGSRVATTGRPKRSLVGLYFRYAAMDGMTVPVFLEVILNPDILPVEKPSVLAHEWAHLAGYADESEANFLAWISCVRSVDPVARYSAWLDAYLLATNALPREMRAALPSLDNGPRQDLSDIAARYARSSLFVRSAARGVYDSYLKANRVEEGIANYAVVLQLLLGTRFDDDWAPRLGSGRPNG